MLRAPTLNVLLLIVASVLMAAGCATMKRAEGLPRQVVEPAVGRAATARVGDVILVHQDYRAQPGLRPSTDFHISGGGGAVAVDYHGRAQTHPVIGTIEWEGKTARVMGWPGANVGLVVDETGRFVGKGIMLDPRVQHYVMPHPYAIDPADTTFAETEGPVLPGTLTYFDLVFAGRTEDAWKLTYREYGSKDATIPLVSFDTLYESSTPLVRLFQFGIQIVEATDAELRYIVTVRTPGPYRAPDIPDKDAAVLDWSSVDLLEIDGLKVERDKKIRLRPGPHSIQYVAEFFAKSSPPRSGIRPNARILDRSVPTFQAGHVYQVKGTGLYPEERLWIEDVTTGEVLHVHRR
jgi:hypothetical protein